MYEKIPTDTPAIMDTVEADGATMATTIVCYANDGVCKNSPFCGQMNLCMYPAVAPETVPELIDDTQVALYGLQNACQP